MEKQAAPKEPLPKFKIPKGPAGEQRPNGTHYPGPRKDWINNNLEDGRKTKGKHGDKANKANKVDQETYFRIHGLQHKSCQTEISAIGGEIQDGSKAVIRCVKILDPKANHGLELPKKERGRRFNEVAINPTIPVTNEGWMDVVWINNKKWTVKQSPSKERNWRDEIIDDETAESLSGYLFKSYSHSFDDEEEYILPNDTIDEVYDDIAEEEAQGVIIDNSEDYDPDDGTWIPEDVLDEDYIAFAPSSQEVKFFKERE